MALLIRIKKIKLTNNNTVYFVSSPDFANKEFFIQIFPKTKLIQFYLDNDLQEFIGEANLKTKEHNISKAIPPALWMHVLIQASKAINSQDFPNDISYCA